MTSQGADTPKATSIFGKGQVLIGTRNKSLSFMTPKFSIGGAWVFLHSLLCLKNGGLPRSELGSQLMSGTVLGVIVLVCFPIFLILTFFQLKAKFLRNLKFI